MRGSSQTAPAPAAVAAPSPSQAGRILGLSHSAQRAACRQRGRGRRSTAGADGQYTGTQAKKDRGHFRSPGDGRMTAERISVGSSSGPANPNQSRCGGSHREPAAAARRASFSCPRAQLLLFSVDRTGNRVGRRPRGQRAALPRLTIWLVCPAPLAVPFL